MRMKYGFLLKKFTESNTLPVFRTESQDRMLSSALNFALGFFGYPLEGQYQQSITIEADGFNNTLAPYKTCPNAGDRSKSDRGVTYVREWASVYLQDALDRLKPQLHGYELTIEDVYTLQQMCAYEVRLCCRLLLSGFQFFDSDSRDRIFEVLRAVHRRRMERLQLRVSGLRIPVRRSRSISHRMDLFFWYGSAFGSPVARVQGIGYIQELVARLTHTPISVHNSSTNATLDDNEATFPLGQSLYVDATHEVVVLNGEYPYVSQNILYRRHVRSHHSVEPIQLRRRRSSSCRSYTRAPRVQVLTPRAIRHQHPIPT